MWPSSSCWGATTFLPAVLGNSDQLAIGDPAYVLGNPFLLASDFTPTVTVGIVSGLHRYQYPAGTFLEYTDCIQFDSSLNPGNSGGPLFSVAGEVVGINGRGSFEKRGRVNVGAGYAISSNQVRHFLDQLRAGRVVDHGTIGATVSTSDDGSVRVATVLQETDAYRRGLRTGDEIVSFAGRPIRSANQFLNVLGIYPSGWTLPLNYRRGAETFTIRVRLADAHRESELREFSESKPDEENPQPGRNPGEPAPDGKNPRKSPRPKSPAPPVLKTPAPPVPPELKALVEKSPGFANYRFNEQEQTRVYQLLKSLGDWSVTAEGLIATGTTPDAQPVELTVVPGRVAGLELGQRVSLQPLGADATWVNEPPGTGGFLAGTALFRSALAQDRAALATLVYFGSEPLDGSGPLVDVLHATDRGDCCVCMLRVNRDGWQASISRPMRQRKRAAYDSAMN